MELLQRSLIKTILGGDCIEFHKVCLSVCFGSVEHREGQFGGGGQAPFTDVVLKKGGGPTSRVEISQNEFELAWPNLCLRMVLMSEQRSAV